MAEHQSKPRAIPVIIAFWAALIFFAFVLGPAGRAVPLLRETAPTLAVLIAVFNFFAFIGTIWAAIGAARLRTIPVKIALAVLLGYPLFVVVKALITGYFSWWLFRFIVFIVLINGLCSWYLLRSSIRAFWSLNVSRKPVLNSGS